MTNVQTAISDIETNGQHVQVNGRILTKADLKTLYDRETNLLNKIARTSSGNRTLSEF